MHQMQRKAAERVGAEEEDGLDVFFWSCGEELYDCHPFGWRAT